MKKITFIILAVLVVAAVFFFLSGRRLRNPSGNRNLTVTPIPTTESGMNTSADEDLVFEITQKYYQFYEDCMKNPPSEAAGKVGEYCQDNSGMTTSDFKTNLEKGGTAKAGADPIVCAQDFPEKITVDPNIQILDNEAKALVKEKFGPKDINIMISFKKEIETWKIDNILCPLP